MLFQNSVLIQIRNFLVTPFWARASKRQ